MPDPKTAGSWAIAPHTLAKHTILGAYLRAWFPILASGRNFNRIVYIDGFAGPGRYSGGEDGSPIIALKAALAAQAPQAALEFHFVERDRQAAASLKANIAGLRAQDLIPSTTDVYVYESVSFEQAYDSDIGPRLAAHPTAPAFALIDPFGWTGWPMRILSNLMKRPSAEILVNFMFEEIDRFLNHPRQEDNFDRLFSCPERREGNEYSGSQRKRYIPDLYRDQLREAAGARYVRSFEMRNERGASDYFLYFSTNNLLGLTKR